MFHGGLLPVSICCFLGLLAVIDGFVWHHWGVVFRWFATLMFNILPDIVYFRFG
jgi:hypothetical protein